MSHEAQITTGPARLVKAEPLSAPIPNPRSRAPPPPLPLHSKPNTMSSSDVFRSPPPPPTLNSAQPSAQPSPHPFRTTVEDAPSTATPPSPSRSPTTSIQGRPLPSRPTSLPAQTVRVPPPPPRHAISVTTRINDRDNDESYRKMIRRYEDLLMSLATQRQTLHGQSFLGIPRLAINRFLAENLLPDGTLRPHPIDVLPDLGQYDHDREDYLANVDVDALRTHWPRNEDETDSNYVRRTNALRGAQEHLNSPK
ncbi:hypothetical protein BDZ89DRAFT_1166614 [Hymenopellis radicata]|nr:hypothetical protein BDZ89DRAFT_1166614 [Hymenopellis radicata]